MFYWRTIIKIWIVMLGNEVGVWYISVGSTYSSVAKLGIVGYWDFLSYFGLYSKMVLFLQIWRKLSESKFYYHVNDQKYSFLSFNVTRSCPFLIFSFHFYRKSTFMVVPIHVLVGQFLFFSRDGLIFQQIVILATSLSS